ncbi:hypothetical protein [Donghicola tyrosinivorans]|uniref:Uncharacterized protein n=1 Tax=Donghicola tyrosinivorans TaxID=1652492 RepID=A0A2T0WD26_9RHOB|nr:hypothetical protein [Donghicola tyrosinivorans]PRY84601.1 hypothetical protein CLV74_12219 [Donghicola tyrosinivorans]
MYIIATFVGIGAFIGFISLVGSPSEVETIIGLIIGAIAFLGTLIAVWRFRLNSHENAQSEKIAALEREIEALKAQK